MLLLLRSRPSCRPRPASLLRISVKRIRHHWPRLPHLSRPNRRSRRYPMPRLRRPTPRPLRPEVITKLRASVERWFLVTCRLKKSCRRRKVAVCPVEVTALLKIALLVIENKCPRRMRPTRPAVREPKRRNCCVFVEHLTMIPSECRT